jgi:SAM-dependent methyltransferase
MLCQTSSVQTMKDNEFECLNCRSRLAPQPVLQGCQDLYLVTPFQVDYVRCHECGLVQVSSVPEDVSLYYEEYPVHQRKSRVHEWMRKLVMAPVYFPVSSLPKGAVLLDYGCGDGWFLESCRGKQLQLVGFEKSATQAERLSQRLGLPVYSDAGSLLSEFANKVDVVTMHFVVEHLTDLHQSFLQVERLLKPGGAFFFTVPNLESWEAKLFGKKWHGLDAPRHISFPHKSVVDQLARRHGLTLAQARTVPFPNGFAGSIPAAVMGRFNFPLYLCALPVGVAASRLFPSGFIAYSLRRDIANST